MRLLRQIAAPQLILFALVFPSVAQTNPDQAQLERRNFAISLINSVADEAKSYPDEGLRSRMLARAGDSLWTVDPDRARVYFRRAWEAADRKDNEKLDPKDPKTPPPMVLALMRASGRDHRSEVLALVAKHDKQLAEELLQKLQDAMKREREDAASVKDGWTSSDSDTKRLVLARKLLEEGLVDRALEFAAPALNQVTANSIGFLSALRLKRADLADQRFSMLMSRVELDPASDANTVSGLSSYLFSPNVYITFGSDGGVRWSQPDWADTYSNPPNVPVLIRDRFFRTAATILLKPLPPAAQDTSSAGRTGKALVIKRLLPLFETYAPQTATALKSQLAALNSEPLQRILADDHRLLKDGIQQVEPAETRLQQMQERVDRTKTPKERDNIYADTAVILATLGDSRAHEIADKVDDVKLRTQLHHYAQLQFIQQALQKKNGSELVKLAKAEYLTNAERSWTLSTAAQYVERESALELLEEAGREARRVEASDMDRGRSLLAVANRLIAVDRVRAWELIAEAVKSGDAVEKFNGENVQMTFMLPLPTGLKFATLGGPELGLKGIFGRLSKDDLYRAVDVAKSFTRSEPRAIALLAVASAVLMEKP